MYKYSPTTNLTNSPLRYHQLPTHQLASGNIPNNINKIIIPLIYRLKKGHDRNLPNKNGRFIPHRF